MSAETDYLRGELNAIKSQLNNQSARLVAVRAIDEGLALLDARDTQERNGMTLQPFDNSVLATLHGSIDTGVAAVNRETVTVKSLAAIGSGLAAIAE